MTLADGYHDVAPGKLATVVTHLEMTAPAPLREVARPDGVTFAPFPRDLMAYRALFRRIGQEWLWFGRLVDSESNVNTTLHDPKVALYTLQKDGQPEALLELDFRVTGACELAYFGLTPALIGTGAGAYLMDRAISLAWSQAITRFHVHTCTLDSPQALAFYVRSGFTPYKRQVEIADDPRLIGIYEPGVAPGMPRL